MQCVLSLVPGVYLATDDDDNDNGDDDDDDDNTLNMYYVPDGVLSTRCGLIHLLLTITEDRHYYYTHLQIRKLRLKQINMCPKSHSY